MSRRFVALALVAAAGALILSGAGSLAAENPYGCGYCIFELPGSGGAMRVVLRNPQVSSIDDLSPTRGEILFSRPDSAGAVGLYAARVDGSGERRLARGERGRWSPDGARVAYDHPRAPTVPPGDPCPGAALWVVDASGANDHAVDVSCTRSAVWSPESGRLAYFAVDGLNADAGTLTTADAAGAARRSLVDLQRPDEVRWSPRGDRLAYTAMPNASPANGHGVAAGGPREFPTSMVGLIRTDGTVLATIRRAESPSWTPTGDQLVFVHTESLIATGLEVGAGGKASLRAASPGGRFLGVLGSPWGPQARWLPGNRVAYLASGPSSGDEDAEQVFTAARDGSHRRQVTHFHPGGTIDRFWFSVDATRLWVLWQASPID